MVKGFTTICDTSMWPVVSLKISGTVDNDKDFQEFTKAWSSLYLRSSSENIPFKLIFNVCEVKHIRIGYLMALAKFLSKVKTLTETWLDRAVIYARTTRFRSMVHFVFNFYKPVRPFRVFLEKEQPEMMRWILSDESGEETSSYKKVSKEDLKGSDDFIED